MPAQGGDRDWKEMGEFRARNLAKLGLSSAYPFSNDVILTFPEAGETRAVRLRLTGGVEAGARGNCWKTSDPFLARAAGLTLLRCLDPVAKVAFSS